MTNEFIEKYTLALNRATDLTIKVQKKGILVAGIDDQLLHDFEQANKEVNRLSKELQSMSR